MAKTVHKLNVEVGLKSAKFTRGMKGMHRQTKGLVAVVAKLGGVIAGVVGTRALARFVSQQLAAVDALAKTSKKLGITTEALAGLHHAAMLSGIQINTMDMALQRMTRRVAEAAGGAGEAKAAIAELGLDAIALARMSPDQVFSQLAIAMEDVRGQADRVRLSFKLFDSEGVALLNTLQLGAKGLQDAAVEAKMLGLAVSGIDAEKVEAFNDAVTRLKATWAGLNRELLKSGVLETGVDIIGAAVKGARRLSAGEWEPGIQVPEKRFTVDSFRGNTKQRLKEARLAHGRLSALAIRLKGARAELHGLDFLTKLKYGPEHVEKIREMEYRLVSLRATIMELTAMRGKGELLERFTIREPSPGFFGLGTPEQLGKIGDALKRVFSEGADRAERFRIAVRRAQKNLLKMILDAGKVRAKWRDIGESLTSAVRTPAEQLRAQANVVMEAFRRGVIDIATKSRWFEKMRDQFVDAIGGELGGGGAPMAAFRGTAAAARILYGQAPTSPGEKLLRVQKRAEDILREIERNTASRPPVLGI